MRLLILRVVLLPKVVQDGAEVTVLAQHRPTLNGCRRAHEAYTAAEQEPGGQQAAVFLDEEDDTREIGEGEPVSITPVDPEFLVTLTQGHHPAWKGCMADEIASLSDWEHLHRQWEANRHTVAAGHPVAEV